MGRRGGGLLVNTVAACHGFNFCNGLFLSLFEHERYLKLRDNSFKQDDEVNYEYP